MQDHHPVLLSRKEIDTRLWDDLVESSVQQNFYAYSWYLDIVSPDWCALICQRGDCYVAALPVPTEKRWLWKVVQQPLFCQYLGFVSRMALLPIQARTWLEALFAHFPYVSAYAFHPIDCEQLRYTGQFFPEVNFAIRHTHWLDLDKSIGEMRSGFSADRRRNIRRGQAAGWKIVTSSNVAPAIDLFQIHHAPNMPHGVDIRLRNILVKLAFTLEVKGAMDIRYAVGEGRVEAGGMFVHMNGSTVYLFNAATEAGRRGNARSLILDDLLRQKSGSKTVFDFESPEVTSIADFYQSFGARRVPYILIRRNPLPGFLHPLQELRGKMVRIWRRLRTRLALS